MANTMLISRQRSSDRRPTAAVLIVAFLAAVKEARITRIVRYMEGTPLPTPPATTRNRVSELARAGQIQRMSYGRYRTVGTL